ncbi:MAG: hypothetical protein R2789_04715 [Microthrixaceae bacterium]
MQSDPLDATRWALEYLTLDGVSHMVSGRRVPEIAFLDGRVSADDGVNFAEGTYELEKDSFSASVSSTTSLSYLPRRPYPSTTSSSTFLGARGGVARRLPAPAIR